MKINFISQVENFKLPEAEKIRTWIKSVIEERSLLIGDLNIIFVSKEEIIEINSKFLKHNYSTDVICFNKSFLNMISGDIVVCIEEVKNNANIYSSNFFLKELNRVIIHGILHLLGYNDRNKVERELMHKKESELLSYLEKF